MLIGRGPELDALAALLASARAGHGGALLLEGDPGVGKSALLRAAVGDAQDATVLEATGAESESKLPYGALIDLATPLIGRLSALPPAQASALAAALAIDGAAGPPDRVAACSGLLGLVADAASRGPVLVVLDDIQWLDGPSSECFGYLARRVAALPVAIVAAVRARTDCPTWARRPEVTGTTVGRITDEQARELVLAGGPVAVSTLRKIVDAARGNPLAVVELRDGLSDAERGGAVPYEPTLTHDGQLWHAFDSRLARLDRGAHHAALVVALAHDPRAEVVTTAALQLGADRAALERCERAGLVVVERGRALLRHPLMRSAILGRVDAPEIRAAHAALAVASAPDAAAWHRADAALGADEDVAAALDAAGWRAIERGAHLAAADAFQRAADLTPDPAAALGRLLPAVVQFGLGGAYDRAGAILDQVAVDAGPELAPAVCHLQAVVALVGGERVLEPLIAPLAEQADRLAPRDPGQAGGLLADAAMIAVVSGDLKRAERLAARGADLVPRDAEALLRAQTLSMVGLTRALRGDAGAASRLLDDVGALLGDVDPRSPAAGTIVLGLYGRICTGQVPKLRREAMQVVEVLRGDAVSGLLPHHLLIAAEAAARLGRWDEAAAEVDEAVGIAEVCGQRGPLAAALALRARLSAARGAADQSAQDVAAALEIAEPAGYMDSVMAATAARGFAELTAGRPAVAAGTLEQVRLIADEGEHEEPLLVPWAPDLVEVSVALGRSEEAGRLVKQLSHHVGEQSPALARAFAARCRGLVAEDFDAPFQAALELHDAVESPFEEARTLLLYGERLHRARRRVEARERLRAAARRFEQLGAEPWRARAAAELAATGGRTPESEDALTPAELRIALAVAAGATNREVAAELFLSPKTIEFHLSRVYRKLGIRSRTQLAGLVADGGVPSQLPEPRLDD